VKAFLDSSVLVATFYAHHEFHAPSIDLFLRFRKHEACCGAHSLAEVYSSLTGRSGRDRVTGDEAMLFLGNIRERLTIVSLVDQDYFKVLEESSELAITGGAVYDALLAHCAVKAKAQTIYTWNAKDFTRFGPAISRRVKRPEPL
jgi:predicted nucleic acid-binding protein